MLDMARGPSSLNVHITVAKNIAIAARKLQIRAEVSAAAVRSSSAAG
jgi:hypothetical protein